MSFLLLEELREIVREIPFFQNSLHFELSKTLTIVLEWISINTDNEEIKNQFSKQIRDVKSTILFYLSMTFKVGGQGLEIFLEPKTIEYLITLVGYEVLRDVAINCFLSGMEYSNSFKEYNIINKYFNIKEEIVNKLNDPSFNLSQVSIISLLHLCQDNPDIVEKLPQFPNLLINQLFKDQFFNDSLLRLLICYRKHIPYSEENSNKIRYYLDVTRIPESVDFSIFYKIFKKFFPSPFAFYQLYSRNLNVTSRLKMMYKLKEEELLSDELSKSIICSVGKFIPDAMVLLEAYISKNIKIPKHVINHVALCLSPQVLRIKYHQPIIVKVLYHLYKETNKSQAIQLLIQALIQFNSLDIDTILHYLENIVNVFGEYYISPSNTIKYQEHLLFFRKVAKYIPQDQFNILMKWKFDKEFIESSYGQEILNLSPSPFDSMVSLVKRIHNGYMNFELTNTRFLELFLEIGIQIQPSVVLNSPYAKDILDTIYLSNPQFICKFISDLDHMDILNMTINFGYIYSGFNNICSKYTNMYTHSIANSNNDYGIFMKDRNKLSNVENSYYNGWIMKEIFKLLILDKDLDTMWKVSLATISHYSLRIVSSILSIYPIPSLKINKMIMIGSKFCIFQNPPLSLANTEVQFIPGEYVNECLENLLEITLYYSFADKRPDMISSIIKARKNIRRVNIVHQTHPFIVKLERDDMVEVLENNSNSTLTQIYGPVGKILIADRPLTAVMEQILKYYADCPHLQSINYIGKVDCHVNFHMHSIDQTQTLSQFKKDHPHIPVKITLPYLEIPPTYTISKEMISLVKKLKFSFTALTEFRNRLNIVYTNLKTLAIREDESMTAIFLEDLLRNAPNLQTLKIACTNENYCQSHLRYIKGHPTVNKLVIKYYKRINDIHHHEYMKEKRLIPAKDPTLSIDNINNLFLKLEDKYTNIKRVHIFFCIRHSLNNQPNYQKKKIPIISQHQIEKEVINLGKFIPTDSSFMKFKHYN